MEKKKPYYITTAIAYTSGKPHIGNVYEIVLTDAIARFRRKEGYDVFFLTGTDEHGQKIEDTAKKEGVSPKEFVDRIAGVVKENFDLMNTTYNDFIRTTNPDHEKTVQDIFHKLYDQGDIYKGEYEGLYCKPCETFLTESQLINGACPECGRKVEPAKEEAYFFNLQKYADRLIQHIEEHPDFIQPESRKNEMLNNFLKPGLQDLCVSRTSFSWGIPVDFDPKHIVYVWIDALSNYITALGYDVHGNSKEKFEKYWPADVHIIGKDILRFHTIYWPIMLMALDLPLPKHIFGHPWLLVGEGKMSKSKGNVIYADELVHDFGVDVIRYFLLNEIPFANDGTLTWELIIEKNNSDLANILGNLVSRTISMQNKYFNGVIANPFITEEIDKELQVAAIDTGKKVQIAMSDFHVSDALHHIFALLRRANKYIDETTPWVLAKEEKNKDRLATVLYNLLETIRIAAVLLDAFIPETATKILDELSTSERDLNSIQEFGNLEIGHTVDTDPEILFDRIDVDEFLKNKEQKINTNITTKPEIAIEDFMKIDLRVGEVIACEKHPKADRLLVSKIDIGGEIRQIVSGIADYFAPKEMIGKKVVVLVNLKSIQLRGVESQGMILCASTEEDLDIISIQKSFANGSKVK